MSKSEVFEVFGGIAAVCVTGCLLFAAYQPDSADIKTALGASVQLEDYCSATRIDDPDLTDGFQNTYLTAKHCMDAEDKIGSTLTIYENVSLGNVYIRSTDGEKVIIKDISETSDLVLMQGMKPGDPDLPKIHIYPGFVQAGTPVYAFGYPRGESLTVTYGMLSYIIKMDSFPDISKSGLWQKAGVAVQGGSSGGGLMMETDTGFELIGTLTWSYNGDEGASYCTPLFEIQEFLQENAK